MRLSRIRPEIATTIGRWSYVWCECHVHVATGSGVRSSATTFYCCDACSNFNLRFIHVLEHVETKKQISVGIECARVLLEDWDLPRLAENEVKRKERWRQHYRTPGRCTADFADLEARGKI
jgi:hypothetical protein